MREITTMKASDLFVRALEAEGVEYIFGIPGEENLDLLDSLSRSSIRLILTRHEQAAGFMGATYGRLTGKAGVCLSTLGPGATNFVTAAAYAQLGAMPMMMTAAGSIRPAKTVVMGAGVAGLQAIATAKRMGSIVSAFDVRPAVKEQVESLGGTFIEVEPDSQAETAGGYAKEMSADYKKRQQDKIAEVLQQADLVITTALIPGKPAPELVSEKVVKTMKAGAVVVDMAIEEWERFYPVFQFVLWSDKNPKDAIEHAMVETQGEA
mgnify:CR=1 FL=1